MTDNVGIHYVMLKSEVSESFDCRNALLITEILRARLASFIWSHKTQRDSVSDSDSDLRGPAATLR